MWTEMNLGSNIITNVPGIILAATPKGPKELMALEVGDRNQQVLVTIDVYDATGRHVAKLRRNAWVFNDKDAYDVTTTPDSLTLVEKEGGRIVLEANVLDRNRVQVLRGDLFTPAGDRIVIQPNCVVFGRGITLRGNRILGGGRGAAIVLGAGGFALGAGM